MEINVTYPLARGVDRKLERNLSNRAARFRGKCTSSGAGFGVRDLTFDFPDRYCACYFILGVFGELERRRARFHADLKIDAD